MTYEHLRTENEKLATKFLPAMTNMHDVAILHDVLFALEAKSAFGTGVGLGTRLQ